MGTPRKTPATLYGWTARRAGGYITITHASGKVTSVEEIGPVVGGGLRARTSDGTLYSLALADEPVS